MSGRLPRSLAAVADRVWHGDDLPARAARALLAPAAWGYGAVVAWRTARGDPGGDTAVVGLPPALSVGNLTVGGTGKTPVASWAATELLRRGAHPAIVLRGYGDDEWRVHERLTPRAPVLIGADRRSSLRAAAARGCDCAVLDDAFQHRRAPRVVDWVLVSADRWTDTPRLLPAGPYREPLAALGRASALVVTAKAAGDADVEAVTARVRREVPGLPVAVVRLALGALHPAAGEGGAVAAADAAGVGPVLALSAVGDPAAFERQLATFGLAVWSHLRYPDHHAFSASDLDHLVRQAAKGAGVVCTLKDAVKLAPRWPAMAVPLWYVSQAVQVVAGREVLVGGLDRVLAARTGTVPTAG